MNAIDCKIRDVNDLVASVRAIGTRLLPGSPRDQEPLRVDVHVRSYDESATLAPMASSCRSQVGRLPVGTLLDCYV